VCEKSGCRKRADTARRNLMRLRDRWLSGFVSLSELAKKKNAHRTTLSRRFARLPDRAEKVPLRRLPRELVLVLDATRIAPDLVTLVAYEQGSRQPFAWMFAERECFGSWYPFLLRIAGSRTVLAVVSDGQKGLKKAAKLLLPSSRRQRCVAHVVRLSLSWLTRRPQSDAGRALRVLVCGLGAIRTRKQAARWEESALRWDRQYAGFLGEKSVNPETGRRWHTHRKLRAVRSLVMNALPDLFHYVTDRRIPNTTNGVEGGINAPLKELLHRHRGITNRQKRSLVSRFLYGRRKEKSPTRNAT
jgi:Transposase, Mutator family